jgi:hypothetical protein
LELAANHNILQIVDVCEEHEKEEKWVKTQSYCKHRKLIGKFHISVSSSPLLSSILIACIYLNDFLTYSQSSWPFSYSFNNKNSVFIIFRISYIT